MTNPTTFLELIALLFSQILSISLPSSNMSMGELVSSILVFDVVLIILYKVIHNGGEKNEH